MIWLYTGDITSIGVDGIVSPDDYHGRMRGDVASRILQAAGESVGQGVGSTHPPGAAWETDSGHLGSSSSVKRIIHVAAMTPDGTCDPSVLPAVTRNALTLAHTLGLKHVAFPAIGTGSGGLGMEKSVPPILSEMIEFLKAGVAKPTEIVCVVLDHDKAEMFKKAAGRDQVGLARTDERAT